MDSTLINVSDNPINAHVPNQLDMRLLGPQGLSPWDDVNSASRKQMFGSHLGQMLTIACPSNRRIQTGLEYEYGKYTFNVTMPENGRILKIIDRFPVGGNDEDSFKMNSERLLIFESDKGEIGIVSLPFYTANHPYFGFQYKPTSNFSQIMPNQTIPKGTVLLDTPNKGPNGEYMYGVEANICMMTHPAVAEDGFAVSDEFLKRCSYHTYEKLVVNIGPNQMWLNIYGDEKKYKSFPDIGELVEPKNEHAGLVMALRDFHPDMIAVDQSVNALRRIDHVFDKCYYADGAGGRVVDIKMYYQPPGRMETNCNEMIQQPLRYARATFRFHKEIVDYYLKLYRERGKSLKLTPEFHRLVVESLAVTQYSLKNVPDSLRLSYKRKPLEEFRCEMVIEYLKVPDMGSKLTDTMGGKGVTVKILPKHMMPRDQYGNVADIIMDPLAPDNRMIPGRHYEQFINATSDNLVRVIRNHLNIPQNIPDTNLKMELENKVKTEPDKLQFTFDSIQNYYNHTTPGQAEWYSNLPLEAKLKDLAHIIKDGIYLHFPPNNPLFKPAIIENLKRIVPTEIGPVTYVGNSGRTVTTKYPVLIGSVYVILLEKVGDDWSAISTSKTQHNGIITFISPEDKNLTPTKEQATRVLGETEFRILNSYVGGRFAAELHDRSSSPFTRREIAKAILHAPVPSRIPYVTNRETNPLGFSKPLQLIREVAACAGWRFTYEPFDPSQQRRKNQVEQTKQE